MSFLSKTLLLGICCWLLWPSLIMAQANGGEGLEIRGNAAEISVNIRDSSGQPILAPTTVKLYRQGAPFDQVSTSKGRVFFIVHALGQFFQIFVIGFANAQHFTVRTAGHQMQKTQIGK